MHICVYECMYMCAYVGVHMRVWMHMCTYMLEQNNEFLVASLISRACMDVSPVGDEGEDGFWGYNGPQDVCKGSGSWLPKCLQLDLQHKSSHCVAVTKLWLKQQGIFSPQETDHHQVLVAAHGHCTPGLAETSPSLTPLAAGGKACF
jgi:hypothetical protein